MDVVTPARVDATASAVDALHAAPPGRLAEHSPDAEIAMILAK